MLDFIAVSQAIFLGKLFQGEIWLDIDLIILRKKIEIWLEMAWIMLEKKWIEDPAEHMNAISSYHHNLYSTTFFVINSL